MEYFPKFSIVTPSFNQAQYLEQTMRSVLNQNYPNLEYIIVDAGSSDSSVEIINQFASHLAYWVSEPDRGHADGINKGFSVSSGEIMAWINSSDVYYPWTLETVAQIFSDIPEAQWITGVGSHLDLGTSPQNIASTYWNIYDFLSGNYSWIQQESVFWRRSLWEEAGGMLNPNIKYACDFELWLRFMKYTPLYHANTVLAGFRYHEERRGDDNDHQYLFEARKCFRSFYNSFGRRHKSRALIIKILNNPLGRILRKTFRKTGLLPWDSYCKVIRNHQSHRWEVVR